MVRHLFVYGTLRSAFQNRCARMLARNATLLGNARVRGRLHNLGRYPALRPAQGFDDSVAGEIYRARVPGALFRALDAYEGRTYRRVLTRAVLDDGREDGRSFPVWLYEYRRSLPWWRRIDGGDYLAHVRVL